jgi:ATP-binding cassette subfamily F protein 3
MAVVSAQNLTLAFGENTLFQNVSFEIGEKDRVGFIGSNGAGKTSLFKILTGEYEPTEGNAFIGKNVKLGYMEQHTCSENKTVWDELVSVFSDLIEMEAELEKIAAALVENPSAELIAKQDLLNNQFNQNGGLTYKSLTRSALIGLGFTEAEFDMQTSKLSGGQRSKLILAKLLLAKADLLLLDEPTNHLDISAVEWLEGSSQASIKRLSLSRTIDISLIKITDKTIELENGKIRSYKGNYSEFLKKKQAEQKAIEEKYENDMREIERLEEMITRFRQWNREKSIKTAESKEKRLKSLKSSSSFPIVSRKPSALISRRKPFRARTF